jgi:hypothetical protein
MPGYTFGESTMFSRLDALLFIAWVVTGCMALEDSHRVDITANLANVATKPVLCQAVPRQATFDPIDRIPVQYYDTIPVDYEIDCHAE